MANNVVMGSSVREKKTHSPVMTGLQLQFSVSVNMLAHNRQHVLPGKENLRLATGAIGIREFCRTNFIGLAACPRSVTA